MPKPVGKCITEDIEIFEVAGRGGMGVVWLGSWGIGSAKREVAVKLIHPEFSVSPESRQRFQQEAELLLKTNHPNVVHVYKIAESDEGQLFILSEFIHGLTLQEMRGEVTHELGIHIAQTLADTVGALFKESVTPDDLSHFVHRDLTPHNVMIDRRGTIKIIDFGLAKLSNPELTPTSAGVKGKYAYSAPECFRGEYSFFTDIFSIGVIFFELMTGIHPFRGASEEHTVGNILHPSKKALSATFKKHCSDKSLSSIAMKLIDPKPETRFEGFNELVNLPRTSESGARETLGSIVSRTAGSQKSVPLHIEHGYRPIVRTVRWARKNPVLAFSVAIGLAYVGIFTWNLVHSWRPVMGSPALAVSQQGDHVLRPIVRNEQEEQSEDFEKAQLSTGLIRGRLAGTWINKNGKDVDVMTVHDDGRINSSFCGSGKSAITKISIDSLCPEKFETCGKIGGSVSSSPNKFYCLPKGDFSCLFLTDAKTLRFKCGGGWVTFRSAILPSRFQQ